MFEADFHHEGHLGRFHPLFRSPQRLGGGAAVSAHQTTRPQFGAAPVAHYADDDMVQILPLNGAEDGLRQPSRPVRRRR